MAGKSWVDANYRFIAAYQEINARIAQRQQALGLYVTLVVSILAALVALKPGATGGQIPAEWLVLGFPVASTCLAFLNYKAERAITNLRRFLSTLERLDKEVHGLPSYNTDPHWAAGANQARRFHDFAAAVLVIGGNGLGLAAGLSIYPERIGAHTPILGLALVLSLGSVLVLLLNPKWSFRPEA
ncbi:hypothetical protein [Zoogloea sp.]|uniref:hypothetical protein n=1 Tax=Zoogloea sp. TaxID=49181 RepID=UPI002601DFA3|nr:hypothetical protein [Zoogloea sp.]MDD3352640.1 hypothetical protein [Zoogloea sp.]